MKNTLTHSACCTLSQQLAQMVNAVCRANTDEHLVGCGVDMVPLSEFEHLVAVSGQIFLDRIFTKSEMDQAKGNNAALAQRFAAKEAVSKALGTGIRGVQWREIEVDTTATPQPCLHLSGNAQMMSAERKIALWELRVSQTPEFALAFAIAWRRAIGLNH